MTLHNAKLTVHGGIGMSIIMKVVFCESILVFVLFYRKTINGVIVLKIDLERNENRTQLRRILNRKIIKLC